MSVSKLARQRGQILDEILADHRERLVRRQRARPLADLRALASVAPPARDVAGALAGPATAIVATCQKASPVRGLLDRHYDAVARARSYVAAGAAAVAVWTDSRHYQGSLEDLWDVTEALPRRAPVIALDFILDPYQVYELRVAGADGLRLLAAAVGAAELDRLAGLCRELGMAALIDVGSAAELERALAIQDSVPVVNRRDWHTFAVDSTLPARLRPLVPAGRPALVTGGLDMPAEVQAMGRLAYAGVLAGAAAARRYQPERLVAALVAAARRTGRPGPDGPR